MFVLVWALFVLNINTTQFRVNKALDLLDCSLLPEEVLACLLRDDPNSGKRQLAVVDMQGQTAIRNPIDADPAGICWGQCLACSILVKETHWLVQMS